jgi:hypothetical protein
VIFPFANNPELEIAPGSGEMERRIDSLDWSNTSIGPRENWSQALRTTVRILLANRFPMLLWWGPDYISIYNDAYIPVLGQKHPWGLGKPVSECWSEIWDILKPLIDPAVPHRDGSLTLAVTHKFPRRGIFLMGPPLRQRVSPMPGLLERPII